MPGAVQSSTRSAWEDRFVEPKPDQLIEHYEAGSAQFFEACRERLSDFEGVEESVSWQGLPWRWTLVYTLEGDPTRAFAYLVADPAAPTVSIPLNDEIVDSMPVKRLKKHIRDGIFMAKRVESTLWATWEIAAKTQLDEVMDIAKRKHKFVVASRVEEPAEA